MEDKNPERPGIGSLDTQYVVVVDLEATCYEDKVFPEGQYQEIIEIGVCLLDTQTGTRSNKRSLIIRPEVSVVSPFCEQLTTITQTMVEKGISLAEACRILVNDYDAKNRTWGSYGNFDRTLFQLECQRKGVEYPFSDHHTNIKWRYAQAYQAKRKLGMAKVLNRLEIPFEGTHHRAHDDAWNTAAIFWKVLQKEREAASGQ